jgi:3-oxoadipate enol-lactonase
MPVVRANDINIYYELHGAGKPVVFINGLGYDLWMWHKMVPGLAKHFQVITFDNRGSGKTDKPPGPYSAQMLADDTTALLQALSIDRAIIIGHSMGGFIAQALAINYPEVVDKLVLAATNFGGPNHVPITPEAMAVLSDMTSDPIERLRRGIKVSCAPGFTTAQADFVQEWLDYRLENPIQPEAYQAQMAIGLALLNAETCFEPRLHQITAPTLILFGEYDKVVPPENAALLARVIPKSQIEIMPDAGHFFPFEAPGRAVDIITNFIND